MKGLLRSSAFLCGLGLRHGGRWRVTNSRQGVLTMGNDDEKLGYV